MTDAEDTTLVASGMSPDQERRSAVMKQLWYGLPLIGVVALGPNVGVVTADLLARSIATSEATGCPPSPVDNLIVEPIAAHTLTSVADITIVKIVDRPTPVLWR